jgi:hypothetical protein
MDYLCNWFTDFLKYFLDYDYYQKKHDIFFEKRSTLADEVARDITQACEADRLQLRVQRWEVMHQLRLDNARCSRLRLITRYQMHTRFV